MRRLLPYRLKVSSVVFAAITNFAMGFMLLVGACGLASAGNGRDFSAIYSFGSVDESANQVRLTIRVRLSNHSGSDVMGATIRLVYSIPASGQVYGSFSPVSVADRQHIVVTQTFLIPLREYQRWKQGEQPRLEIEFTDSTGKLVRRPVEAALGLVGGAN